MPGRSVAGRDLDEFIAGRVLAVLEPGALEWSLAAADDLEQERGRLEQHGRQRLERARQQVERAARQYRAVEPENRLVARTLEREWEEALRAQEGIAAEYETFRRLQPARLTDAERAHIRQLGDEVRSLWDGPGTTPQDRQQIVRLLLDRIDVNVVENTERVELTLHWAGGVTSVQQHTRPVRRYDQLSNRDELLARITALQQAGRSLTEIAEQLNREGFRPPKRRCNFTGQMLGRLLRKQRTQQPSGQARAAEVTLLRHEWRLSDLARQLGMPAATLNRWRKVGWVAGRKVEVANGRWVLWADDEELSRLRRLRDHPRGWSDKPYPTELTTPKRRSDR